MEEKSESRTRRKLAAGAVSAAILLLLIYATRPEPQVPQVPELDAETGAPLADAAPGAGLGELADAGSAAPQAEGDPLDRHDDHREQGDDERDVVGGVLQAAHGGDPWPVTPFEPVGAARWATPCVSAGDPARSR